VTNSTFLNQTFGSSPRLAASRRIDWILPGPALYEANAKNVLSSGVIGSF
jgi:hypothetical protein